MVYVNPRIKNELLYDFYTNDYFYDKNKGYVNYELTAPLRIKTFQRWWGELKPYVTISQGNALDIGCAAGYFLDILAQQGWKVEGIELDGKMRDSVRNRGYTVHETPIEYFNNDKRYHLITLFDVVEHLPSLHSDFQKLSQLLEMNGLLVLVTPNMESLQRKLFGKRWFQLKPHEHILYFTPKTLQRLAKSHGFIMRYCRPSGQYADTSFILDRLNRYGFLRLAKSMRVLTRLFGLSEKSWYASTGSILVILQKKE
jgi:2-polyprenyl-3-methyl-5-hydroxy-6-metoxy-1,4-benzoquinol methylase